jgi:ATP-binding cassette subfamily F protein 3
LAAPKRSTASERSTAPERATAPERKAADHTGVRDSRESADGGSAGAISGPPHKKSLKKETADSRKAIDREIKAIKVRLSAVETQIQELEARQQEIGLALADPDLYRDGQKAREIAQSRKETEERVAWLMKEWEELSQRLSTAAGEAR